jgi:rRNA maturation endonuclease Nob1
MSKNYSKTFTSLKTVTHDTSFLDAQKITVNTDSTDFTQRKNVVEYIDEKDSEIKSDIENTNVRIDELTTFNGIEKDLFDKIVSDNVTRYTEYNTNVFDLSIEGGNVITSSVRFDNKHLPQGIIKSVSFYAQDSSSTGYDAKTNGCYLLANVYKTDGTLVRSYSSTNKVVVLEKISVEPERPINTWLFEGIPSIGDDEIIKFIPSPDGINQTSNYYFGIRVDSSHTHANCQVGGDGDFVNNPL